MKISDLISRLEEIRAAHGDLPVFSAKTQFVSSTDGEVLYDSDFTIDYIHDGSGGILAQDRRGWGLPETGDVVLIQTL